MGLGDKLVGNLINKAGIETFQDSRTQLIVDVVILVVYILLVILLGKYLWNNVLCKAVTVVKPLPNVWHFLGLVVLQMLF
jgi:hypothetical protein